MIGRRSDIFSSPFANDLEEPCLHANPWHSRAGPRRWSHAGHGGADAYGTFGFELFRDYLLTIDDPQNEVRVETGGLPRADGLTVLTYHLDLGAPYIDIDVGGHRLRASIDAEMPVG